MKILVDALPARDGGGLTYLIEQVRAIEAVAPDLTLELLAAPWSYSTIVDAVRSVVHRVGVRTVADRFAFEQTVLRNRARKWDLLYCPLNFGPMFWGGSRTVLTLHNSNYFAEGLHMAGTKDARPWVKVKACHAAVRECHTVVAISHSLRESVIQSIPTAAPKIRVVKSGRPNWDSVQPEPMDGAPQRFMLTVGSPSPHKRLEQIVEGWSTAVSKSGEEVGLIVMGDISEATKRRHRAIASVASPLLLHVGAVSSRGKVRWLYEHATAMVSMSVLEAFPLTVAEAGALGCPMVLSDIPAHREVSLGNAIFIQPESPEALGRILPKAFAGRPRSRPWMWPITWQDHAIAMVRLFESVME